MMTVAWLVKNVIGVNTIKVTDVPLKSLTAVSGRSLLKHLHIRTGRIVVLTATMGKSSPSMIPVISIRLGEDWTVALFL